MALSDQEKDEIAAEVRRQVIAFMTTPEFEQRAKAACAAIDRGELRTDAEIADALGLPENFVSFALGLAAREITAPNTGGRAN
ncbi:hypothetical protein [Bradyrhizobium zhanjiangense]|uniref:Uncharacterized protein n=1 Tax=Bradyrhizobium zhanjiangense TaxID=1325107 RepID=A0A4Q0SQB9_9BRAD|nr:hypothetical protein [Bradyrhizobium zhanjiangense]RXH41070.1 hypothetical protein XH94_09510 [Bradyrhizobium zhanjiangense]